MQLKHLRQLLPASNGMTKVTAMSWSPNGKRFAVVTTEKIVLLFDENGDRRDKIPTRPATSDGSKVYQVRALAFSPDSNRVAVAQSDNIVFVYKIGTDWGDKKTICNKFLNSNPVTACTWPKKNPNDVCYGLSDGKVKIGNGKSNKSSSLYHVDSCVISLASSPSGDAIASGHLNGQINVFFFETRDAQARHMKLATHTCAPTALSWGVQLVAAGADAKVYFYEQDGRVAQTFDFNHENEKEFTCAGFNPSGEAVTLGSYDKFRVFTFNPRRRNWEESMTKTIKNLYTVPALTWRPDGSRLTVGGLCGSVDEFESCLKRFRYKGKFDINYVSLSQIVVTTLLDGTKTMVRSAFGYEIDRIKIYEDRYFTAVTPETLLLADLANPNTEAGCSEIPWRGGGNVKFIFDNPRVCIVNNAGELSFVEYGVSEILGSCRTEHSSPHLISVRINTNRLRGGGDSKKVAYLIDLQTIVVLDLVSGISVANVAHDSRIDWLELNMRASKLLFRDKRRTLHLYDLETQTRTTLLNFCSYVQWVPNSDVCVAQNRGSLCVWYSIDTPERVNVTPINGDIEEIVRSENRTEVLVDEGLQKVAYALDEPLIAFGAAVEEGDLNKGVRILEAQEMSPEIEAMWKNLASLALDSKVLPIAERCYAALGDVSRAKYIRGINKIAVNNKDMGGMDHFMVKARLSILDHQFKAAEAVLLDNGQVEEAMDMYQELHQWDSAIAVAESKGHPDVENLRRDYFNWLIDTQQEEKAAAFKEKEGDYIAAINLCLKGGMPVRAAYLVNTHNVSANSQLLETIATSLSTAGMEEKAGEFYEKLGRTEDALRAYRRGHAYRRAVELSRRVNPGSVVQLEGEWGDYLVSQRRVDAAINHYIEAGQGVKALDAALDSRQWSKAVQIAENQDPNIVKPHYRRIAKHYDESGNFAEAEKYYIRAGHAQDAVDMYTKQGLFDNAVKVANTHMPHGEVSTLNVGQAQRLEQQGKYKEAEKFYIAVNEVDLAINMYKKARQFDAMIRLVRQHRKEMLPRAHEQIAQDLAAASQYKDAERHFVEAKKWKLAVQMYRSADMWEDSVRVANLHGGDMARKRVVIDQARSLGLERGIALLNKQGLVEDAIEDATSVGDFGHAFALSEQAMPSKVADVHYKYAMHLEDEGQFREAEDHFVKAGKPKEAIDMYIHQQDWAASLRVAETYDPQAVNDVTVAQARAACEAGDFSRGETLFLQAHKPDLCIQTYKDARRYPDALRVAKEHLPRMVAGIEEDMQRVNARGSTSRATDLMASATEFEKAKQYNKAIDLILQIQPDSSHDKDYLEEAWENAVNIAMMHKRDRIPEVLRVATERLCTIGRFEQAAELCEGVEDYDRAIECYNQGGLYEKAKALQNGARGGSSKHLGGGSGGSAMGGGRSDPAPAGGNSYDAPAPATGGSQIDVHFNRGEYDQAFQLAGEEGPDVQAKYVGMRAARLAQDKATTADAIALFSRYGAPAISSNYNTYRLLTKDVFGNTKLLEDGLVIGNLRTMLYSVVDALKSTNGDPKLLIEFEHALRIVHLLNVRLIATKNGLKEIAAKSTIALVRHVDELPADKIFLDAGLACKDMEWLSQAFVFLNRYLDLAEAMDDPDTSGVIENSDFEHTDIPYDFALPETQYLDEEKREEVRDWVLAVSMDQQVDQVLSHRSCDKCGTDIYEAGLNCPNCQNISAPGVVTGYPVRPSKTVSCTSCHQQANRDDWNRWLMKMKSCPWCNSMQNPSY